MATPPLDDALLIKAIFGGNTEAFGNLVQKYQSFVCAVTFSATGSQDKSEELAQDVFVLAWQHLSKLKDPTRFKSWLYSITKNRIKAFYRHQKREPLSHAVALDNTGPVVDSVSPPPETLISQEQQEFVRQALSRIPESYRELLVLFYREGKSVKQVAECFELTEAAAKKRLSRGRQMIKSNLNEMVEHALTTTRPKATFSAGVLGIIAASGGISKAAAASGAAHVVTHPASGLLQGMTAKIAAVTAAAIVGAGALTYVATQSSAEPIVRTLPAEMNKGLVLHLSFDEATKANGNIFLIDESRTGNDGFLTGGQFVEGHTGKALLCSAKNRSDGVVVKDADSLDLDAVTVAAWVRTERIDGQWGRILDKGWETAFNLCVGGDFKGESWYRDRGQLECAGRSVTSNTPVVDGKWHFLAGTYDGTTLRFYVDGAQDNEVILKPPKDPRKPAWNEASPLKENDANIHIGNIAIKEPAPNDEAFFDGLIDEVRVYSRTLSPEEIQTLYRYQPF